MGSAVRKVRGGKLLRVRLEHNGSAITAVAISGDFFIYPEEGLEILEKGLEGVPVTKDEKAVASRVKALMDEEGITTLGFGPNDLAEVIIEAIR